MVFLSFPRFMNLFLVDSWATTDFWNCSAATSDTSARSEDHEMDDAVTSKPGMTLVIPFSVDWLLVSNFDSFSAASSNVVIDLPDDDDEEPPRQRRSKKASAGKATRDVPAPETLVVEGDNVTRPTVTFAVPLTSACPSSSSAAQPSLFSTYRVPEDQANAAKEAIR